MWGMKADVNLGLVFFSICLPIAILFLLSRISGWDLLARRFRANGPFCGEMWNWQSARFRGWFGYNNCLIFGASPEGLYLAMMPLFRIFGHPALLIPWTEIEVEMGRAFFGETVQFRIGTEERVTVKIYGKVVDRVRQGAGTGWPLATEVRAR
jgi:hypothetical protein